MKKLLKQLDEALPTVLLGRWLRTRGAESFEVM